MTTKYTHIDDGRRARVHNGALYVMQTNMSMGMLEQGGYADRVYRMPYAGSLGDAVKTYGDNYPHCDGCPQKSCIGPACTVSDIDRCIESGTVIRRGRLIQ